MPIRSTTPIADIEAYMRTQWQRKERAIVRTLSYIGEQCVNTARSTNSYKDQTGNLRSSIGYVVSVNGKIRSGSDFGVVKDGADGAKTGKGFARELAAQYPNETVLIVVAGMNYAKYVAAKGYDVIAGAELQAERLVPKLLQQLVKLDTNDI